MNVTNFVNLFDIDGGAKIVVGGVYDEGEIAHWYRVDGVSHLL